MADLPEVSDWSAGVYQIETTDPVLGGTPNRAIKAGIANQAALELANRTLYLLERFNNRTTSNAILSALLSVDGAASGLDADTVDGKHASAFVLLSDLLSRITMVDGAGSGIDADLLDGKQGAEYLAKTGGTVSGPLSVTDALNVFSQIVFGRTDGPAYIDITDRLVIRKADGTIFARIDPNGTGTLSDQTVMTREKGDNRYLATATGGTIGGQLDVRGEMRVFNDLSFTRDGISYITLTDLLVLQDTAKTVLARFEGAGPNATNEKTILTREKGDGRYWQEAQAARSLAASGYQRLPSGLILQWGRAYGVATGDIVVFPTSFPNNLFQVIPADPTSGSTEGVHSIGINVSTLSNVKFTVIDTFGSSTTSDVSYFAIGN